MMRTLAFVMLIAAGIGCQKDSKPTTGSGSASATASGTAAPTPASAALDDHASSEPALKELASMKDAACACTTFDCASKVEASFTEWSKRNAATKGSPSQAERASKLIGDISDCILKWESAIDAGAQPTK
jgi:hypothetical protein